MHRRHFVTLTLGAATATSASSLSAQPSPRSRFKAVAFDGFPILDPRPVFALAEELFPGRGTALSDVWKIRQFEYSWLRTMGSHYVDFWQITQDALVYAARATGVELIAEKRERLMNAYLQLETWPDVLPVLRRFRDAGLTCSFLSNFSPRMLAGAMASAGLDGLIAHAISTDQAHTYKPDPRAYKLGVDLLGFSRDEILFVPFAAWDAAGAKWFGYPTFWVNRLKQPGEELSVTVDGMGNDLLALEKFVFAGGTAPTILDLQK